MPLFPVASELNDSRGVIGADIVALPTVDPEKKITLGRLTGYYGDLLGSRHAVTQDHDSLLELETTDFELAEPKKIESGLYIYPDDPRYNHPSTEQLVRLRAKGDWFSPGVVFPSQHYATVARSPANLAEHVMNKTRKAKDDKADRVVIDASVGRSAGHALKSKMSAMNSYENELLSIRSSVLIPLYRETLRNLSNRPWDARFKAKNLDKKRKIFDEMLHDTVETSTINQDISITAINGLHRAITSQLYRYGSNQNRSQRWKDYILLYGTYTKSQCEKIQLSKQRTADELKFYEQFLDNQLTKPTSV